MKQTYIRLTEANKKYIEELSFSTGLTRNAIINYILQCSMLKHLDIAEVNIKNVILAEAKNNS